MKGSKNAPPQQHTNDSPHYAYGHPILSEGQSKYPPHPDERLPEGWVYRKLPRQSRENQSEKHWFSPVLKFKFRSLEKVKRFLVCLEKADGDEIVAINMYSVKGSGNPNSYSSSFTNSTLVPKQKSSSAINVGDVGYSFRKRFDNGWFDGKVVKIRPGADNGRDRRCLYSDGDSEDLSLHQLHALALKDPEATKFHVEKSRKHPSGNFQCDNSKVVTDKNHVNTAAIAPKGKDPTKPRAHSDQVAGRARDVAYDESSGIRRSGRAVRAPRKIDEIYNYEHVKHLAKRAKTTAPQDHTQLLSSCLNHTIPSRCKAAESTLNSDGAEKFLDTQIKKKEADPGEDDKEWLEKVAASLGADVSTQRQRRFSRSINRSSTNSSVDGPLHGSKPSSNNGPSGSTNAMKSDAASACSTISCTSKVDNDSTRQPPDAVVVSHLPSALGEPVSGAPPSLVGCLVFHKNDSRRRVGEAILEQDSWVEVIMDGSLKKYRRSQLHVVPPDQFQLGDTVPSDYSFVKAKKTAPKSKISSSSEHKPSSVAHLFVWYCKTCGTDNMYHALVCHSCSATKTADSKESILLSIATTATMHAESVKEAMGRISDPDRPSIPEALIHFLLESKKLGSDRSDLPCSLESSSYSETQFFYWLCAFCTMRNSFKRTTCKACLQSKGNLSDRSPLLKIAEGAAMKKTAEDALSSLSSHERSFIPKTVMDALCTCVFIIEGKNGQRRRCLKQKKFRESGGRYDYCEAHFDPALLGAIKPCVADTTNTQSSTGSPSCNADDLSQISLQASHSFVGSKSVRSSKGIANICERMPSFLANIHNAEVNKLSWSVNCIENAVLCGEDAAVFPLGMKVRKFFSGFGFHDGRIIKVARKLWSDVDSGTSERPRPVLVYRLKYNDGDQEDFLHHEIASMRTIYDVQNVSPEASPQQQVPRHSRFETQFGTVEIVGHKTPVGIANRNEGGIVSVRLDSVESDVEISALQISVLRKIEGPSNAESDVNKLSHEIAKAPVLEWPGRGQSQADAEQICEGLSLHRKLCNISPDGKAKSFFPISSTVNNPADVRPGYNIGMWDPAGCYGHLSWDPFASTICEICGVDRNDNQVVICDECHSGFHTFCLRPVMVNIPKGFWMCSACSAGRSDVQISFQEFCDSMSHQHGDILKYLRLPYGNISQFFQLHSEALSLCSLQSQNAVKQRATSQQVKSNKVVFDVGGIMFIRSPEKNDWLLPTPLVNEEDYGPSILSMVAAMKYCGMEVYTVDHIYSGNANEEMNDPSLEVDKISPMSRRNLEIFKAYKHNLARGIFPPIQVFHDDSFGFCVKALSSIPRHTIIGEYLGEVVTMEQSSQSSSDSLMVLLDTGDPKTSLMIDPTVAGNIARFLSGVNNRSLLSKRKANVRTRRFFMDGRIHVCLFTLRRVEAGEILNYDYNAGLASSGKNAVQWARSGFYDTSNFF